jgi:hypothetical protein
MVKLAPKVLIAALVIFVSGVISGALGHRLYSTPPALAKPIVSPAAPRTPHTHNFLARMEQELNLTPDQTSHIAILLQELDERMKKIYEPVKPEAKQEFDRVNAAIRETLNPEQQEKFELMRQKGRHHQKTGAKSPEPPTATP